MFGCKQLHFAFSLHVGCSRFNQAVCGDRQGGLHWFSPCKERCHEQHFTLLQWMLGLLLGGMISLMIKAFFSQMVFDRSMLASLGFPRTGIS